MDAATRRIVGIALGLGLAMGVHPAVGQVSAPALSSIEQRLSVLTSGGTPLSVRVTDERIVSDGIDADVEIRNEFELWYVLRRTDTAPTSDLRFPDGILVGPNARIPLDDLHLAEGATFAYEAAVWPDDPADRAAIVLGYALDLTSRLAFSEPFPPELFWDLATLGTLPPVGLLGTLAFDLKASLRTALGEHGFRDGALAPLGELVIGFGECFADLAGCDAGSLAGTFIDAVRSCKEACRELLFDLLGAALKQLGISTAVTKALSVASLPAVTVAAELGPLLLHTLCPHQVFFQCDITNPGGRFRGPFGATVGPIPDAPTLIAIGDSISAGHGVDDDLTSCRRAAEAWPNKLARSLHRRTPTLISHHVACSGAVAGEAHDDEPLKALDAQVSEVLRLMPEGQPTLVTATIGINDMGWTSWTRILKWTLKTPGNFQKEMDAKRDEIANNIVESMSPIFESSDTAELLLATVYDPLQEYPFGVKPNCVLERCPARFAKISGAVSEAAYAAATTLEERFGDRVHVADVRSKSEHLVSWNGPRRLCGPDSPDADLASIQHRILDCFHPSERGHRQIADWARNALPLDLLPVPAGTGDPGLAIVIDVSGSMDDYLGASKKLDQAKVAAHDILDTIVAARAGASGSTSTALITFSSAAEATVPLGDNLDTIGTAVDALSSGGGTNIGDAMTAGFDELIDARERTMVLLSDGARNEGPERDEILGRIVDDARQLGIKVFTVGFGEATDEYDGDLLREIATRTGGSFGSAETLAELRGRFVTAAAQTDGDVIATLQGSLDDGELADAGRIRVPVDQDAFRVSLVWDDLAPVTTDVIEPTPSPFPSTSPTATALPTEPGVGDVGADLDIVLVDPSGRSVDATYPGGQVVDSVPESVVVTDPVPGMWSLKVHAEHATTLQRFFAVASVVAAVLADEAAVGSGAGRDVLPLIVLGVGLAAALWLLRPRRCAGCKRPGWRRTCPRCGTRTTRHRVPILVAAVILVAGVAWVASRILGDDATIAAPATEGAGLPVPLEEPSERWANGTTSAVVAHDDGWLLVGDDEIKAVDRVDGSERWATSFATSISAATPGTDLVAVGFIDGSLVALDGSTGGTRWTAQLDGTVLAPLVEDGRIVAATASGTIAMLSPDSGEELWRISAGPLPGPPAIVGDALVAVSPQDGIQAFDPSTGELRWRADANAPATLVSADHDDVVVIAGSSVLALDPASGVGRWQTDLSEPIDAPASIDGDIVTVVGREGTLAAIDRATGELRWRIGLEGRFRTAPTIGAEAIAVTSSGGVVWGVDRQLGRIAWRLPSAGPAAGPAIAHGSGSLLVPGIRTRSFS
jgi:outer membrane protein assembly factor BamB/lysophospholipase L1-like esterase